MQTARWLIVISACLANSCSYSYDMRAVVIGNQLAFVVAPQSSNKRDCISRISVSTDGSVTAISTQHDDKQWIADGVFWAENYEGCFGRFPIYYGKSQQSVVRGRSVAAKPLKTGIVYMVETTSNRGASGSGYFRVRLDRSVENVSATEFWQTRTNEVKGAPSK